MPFLYLLRDAGIGTLVGMACAGGSARAELLSRLVPTLSHLSADFTFIADAEGEKRFLSEH
jgi:hypothetical protein